MEPCPSFREGMAALGGQPLGDDAALDERIAVPRMHNYGMIRDNVLNLQVFRSQQNGPNYITRRPW